MKRYLIFGYDQIRVDLGKKSFEKYFDENYKTNFAFVLLRSAIVKNDLTKSNIISGTAARYQEDEMDISNGTDAVFYFKNEHFIDINKFRESS